MISPAIVGVESGTWKARRKARQKAANWGGSRARMHSCRVWMVGGSRGARAAVVLVAEERLSAGRDCAIAVAAAWGRVVSAGATAPVAPLPSPWLLP